MFDITHPNVRASVERALDEDIGVGDVTTALTVPADLQTWSGRFVAKEDFALAGIELAPLTTARWGLGRVTFPKR